MRYTVSRLAIAAAMAAGLAVPALADVTVTVDVSKTKDVSVVETITINKEVTVTIGVTVDLDRAAEAMALVNQVIEDNTVDRDVSVVQSTDGLQLARAAAIDGHAVGAGDPGSINDNAGVTGFNQDIGAMTNQGNIWSVALTEDDDDLDLPGQNQPPDVFADAQAEVDQRIGGVEDTSLTKGNTVFLQFDSNALGENFVFSANIEDSINDNIGLTGVNQNAGNMNDQANAVAVGAGLIHPDPNPNTPGIAIDGAAVAMAESALGQETAFNTVFEGDVGGSFVSTKLGTMLDSVTGNAGITQVNQSAANMTNQGNVASVGAAVLAPQPQL